VPPGRGAGGSPAAGALDETVFQLDVTAQRWRDAAAVPESVEAEALAEAAAGMA
jgi:hypothetical protein